MTALLVVLLCAIFIVIDVVVRHVSNRVTVARVRREREQVLKTHLNLTFADEARSLKRAELPQPRARILAVDDEPVVLDSLRKILVLAGYSIDTVESGPEALTLVRAHDYDFVFTDLKMPEMSGVEVVKAIKHLRPDVDVAVITGFGSIETAVETMSHGAIDYIQKPFTEEELVAFANRLVIKRQARLEAQQLPPVHIVTPAMAEVVARREYSVPGGAFIAPGHTWVEIEAGGKVCIGLDDFARKALRRVERVELPEVGGEVRRGAVLFVLRRGDQLVRVRAPLTGKVTQVNPELRRSPGLIAESPYDRGWVCELRPQDLSRELPSLRIGDAVIEWYRAEIARLRELAPEGAPPWPMLDTQFLAAGGSAPVRHEPQEQAVAG
jgi:CheY-like chemotaxis protein/glycine cleavage system H lipoate-binding protein